MTPIATATTSAEDSHGAPIEIQVLGEFSIFGLGGQGLGQIDGRTHVRALLALTAASHAGVTRDEVADVLWPKLQESAARNRLYHTMYLARQALSGLAWPDEWLHLRQGRIQLDTRIRSDAHRIESLLSVPVEQIGEIELMRALDLYRGDWAPDVNAGGLGNLVRRRLRDWHVALLSEAARRRSAEGDTPARRQLLEKILSIHPTDESAWQQLMTLDLEVGRYNGVLRSYEVASRSLSQDLGLRPSRPLSDIAALASTRLGVDGDRIDRFTSGAEMLLGRQQLVNSLLEQISSGPGIWNVYGLGGVGKSALMREVTRRSGPARPDGAVLVSISEAPARSIADTVTRAIGQASRDDNVQDAGWTAILGSRDLLVVLDDLDRHPEGVTLLSAAPEELRSRIVVVTHSPLSWPGIRQVHVPPLAVPEDPWSIAQARHASAVTLYRLRRPVADIDEWSDQHWREVVALVRKLDGLPLAIELAAARSGTMTAGEILAQLERRRTPDQSSSDVVRSLAMTLELSVGMLDPEAVKAMQACAAIPGWFTPEAAASVSCAAGFESPGDIGETLDRLADAGLLDRRSGQFRMLHVTRDHARNVAVQRGVWSGIQRARRMQVIDHLEARACDIESPGYTAWLDEILVWHDEAMSLLDAVENGDAISALRIVLPLMHSWVARGMSTPALARGLRALEVGRRQGDTDVWVTLATQLAILYLDRREVDQALEMTALAMSAPREALPAITHAYRLSIRAEVLSATGPIDVALELISRALRVEIDPCTSGWWTLKAQQIELSQVFTLTKDNASSWIESGDYPLAAWRARLSGSQTWCDLLMAISGSDEGMDAAERLEVCVELLQTARALRAPRAVHAALSRQAWALMALDRIEDSERAIIDWYRTAHAGGQDSAGALACLWLAEFAWRQEDVPRAQTWVETARRMASFLPAHHHMHQAIHMSEIAMAAVRGDLAAGIAHFVALPADFLASARRGNLEHLVEVGALLARLARLDHLFRSLSSALAPLSNVKDNVPLVNQFRARHLGDWQGVSTIDATSAERVGDRARADLATLHQYLRSATAGAN